ncbi:hypothetical protein GGS23DRAFT_594645 [Durotheca rogersii]|uniref:uncharacterized protein n=1 Tax=Durotheca rogersii TaxID=419775 RepID=UPI00221F8FC9|nr:uncharacterized protein GGS23DRAFT_594645 [Durotheca rogersii]KAI5865090.1 hypothetical protein GGS23DRAFT_594645 [Durotheca rogersii]
MESSPLIKAHDHARAASIATQTSDTTVAVNEHTRAAGEFANAAKNTSSVEALRTLKLLEQHHRRLSEILQIPGKHPASQPTSEDGSQGSEKDEAAPGVTLILPAAKPEIGGASSEKNAQPMPTLPKQPRYPARDLGASIASNLASARGIRSKYRTQPLIPSVSNTEAPGNMETASRRSGPRTKMQSMLDNSDKPNVALPSDRERLAKYSGSGLPAGIPNKERAESATSGVDEGFSRFYSAFGSIINRISAPLAFAGLPLISEEQTEEPAPVPESPAQKRNKVRVSASFPAEPDLRKLYSKAALRAVSRDGPSANDSFYVVPTSGHTASYASILTFADKEKRRMEAVAQGVPGNLLEEVDEDDFVDARESQVPRSPALQKLTGKTRSERGLTNVVEELYLENKSLKDMLDKLSKRLHAFESMSQNSGMRLAESMRLMRPASPLASGGGGGTSKLAAASADETLAKRTQELEEQVQLLGRRNDELRKENNKLKTNLDRYRDKWEQLKAGAKARRASGIQGSSEAADDGTRSPSLG